MVPASQPCKAWIKPKEERYNISEDTKSIRVIWPSLTSSLTLLGNVDCPAADLDPCNGLKYIRPRTWTLPCFEFGTSYLGRVYDKPESVLLGPAPDISLGGLADYGERCFAPTWASFPTVSVAPFSTAMP